MDVARASSTYRPRDAEHSILHTVIREHLERFLREVSDRGDSGGLPRFVEQEFREFLTCEPVEFLEKLAALTPRPEINLALYHGVLAPHALAARRRRLPPDRR